MLKWRVPIPPSGGDLYPEAWDPLQCLTLILVQLPWLQRWPKVWCTQPQQRMRTRMRMKLSIAPGAECLRRQKENFPCALKRRCLHCPNTVNAHWVFSLLDLNKVFTNMQGINRIHVTPVCLSGLWAVTQKVLGHFTERTIANTAKSLILGSGQRWIRHRGQETAEEGKMHQRINWKGSSYSD